jgi:hypothetical protein
MKFIVIQETKMEVSQKNVWGFDQYGEEFRRDTAGIEETGKRERLNLFRKY